VTSFTMNLFPKPVSTLMMSLAFPSACYNNQQTTSAIYSWMQNAPNEFQPFVFWGTDAVSVTLYYHNFNSDVAALATDQTSSFYVSLRSLWELTSSGYLGSGSATCNTGSAPVACSSTQAWAAALVGSSATWDEKYFGWIKAYGSLPDTAAEQDQREYMSLLGFQINTADTTAMGLWNTNLDSFTQMLAARSAWCKQNAPLMSCGASALASATGKISQVPQDFSAYYNRNNPLNLIMSTGSFAIPLNEPYGSTRDSTAYDQFVLARNYTQNLVVKWREIMQAKSTYVGSPTPENMDPLFRQSYYGTHYSRLYAIKNAYDPQNLFSQPQNVGPSDGQDGGWS